MPAVRGLECRRRTQRPGEARAGHDYGSTVEVMSSLTADDAIIIDLSDSILDGTAGQFAETTQKASAQR
jgi:hypothetical protein